MKRLTERDEFGNADIIGVDSMVIIMGRYAILFLRNCVRRMQILL